MNFTKFVNENRYLNYSLPAKKPGSSISIHNEKLWSNCEQKIYFIFIFATGNTILMNNMKSISALFLTIFLSFSCKLISAEDNPFMDMAGKKYADYSLDLYYKYLHFDTINLIKRQKMMEQIKETAVKTGSKTWELELKYAELAAFDIENRGKSKNYIEKELKMALDLLEEAKKNNILYMELKVRYDIIEDYCLKFRNYENASRRTAATHLRSAE